MRRRLGILAVVLTMLLVASCEGVATGASKASSQEVAGLPNVVGKRLLAAHDALSAAGFDNWSDQDALSLNRDILEFNNWVVRSQKPAPGANVSKSSKVTLLAGKPTDGGSVTITMGVVPNVVCRNYSDARNLLNAAGFGSIRAQDATDQARHIVAEENWVVVGQTVPAGRKIEQSERIVLKLVKYGESASGSGCHT